MTTILLVDSRSVWHEPPRIAREIEEKINNRYNQNMVSAIEANEQRMQITHRAQGAHSISTKYVSNYGQLMIAGELTKRGHTCKYVNADYFPDFQAFSAECVNAAKEADIVCMTTTTPQYSEVLDLARILTKDNTVLLGGPHTIEPQSIAEEGVFDAVLRGYNVLTICDTIEGILQEGPSQPRGAQGPGQPRGAQGTKETRVFACEGYVNAPRMFSLIPKDKLADTLLYTYTSMGCPNKCAYCCEHKLLSSIFNFPIEECLDELRFLVDEANMRLVHFCDSDLLLNERRSHQLLDMIEENNIKTSFSFMTSPKAITRKGTVELLQRWVEAGLVELMVGVEYFSDPVSKLHNKPFDIPAFYDAMCEITEKVDIPIISYLSMIGLPGETEDTIRENLYWWEKFSKAKLFHFALPKFFVPYPGTTVYNNPELFGFEFLTNDWKMYHRRSLPRPIRINNMDDELFLNELASILALNQF